MESAKGLALLKDTLELVRNYVFGSGLVAVAGVVAYQDWSLSPFLTANVLSFIMAIVGIAYLLGATFYFVITHQPPKERRAAQALWFIGFIAILSVIAEIGVAAVVRQATWQHNQAKHAVALGDGTNSSSGAVKLRVP